MEQEYVVQEGDNLTTILYNFTGDGSYANAAKIAEQNGIENPSHIEPGQTIKFTVESTEASNSTSGTSTSGSTASSDTSYKGPTSVPTSNSSSSSSNTSNTYSEVAISNDTSYKGPTDVPKESSTSSQTTDTSTTIPNPKTNAATGAASGLATAMASDGTTSQTSTTGPSTTTSTTTQTATESSASQSTSRNSTFSYGMEDDNIEYNVDDAKKILLNSLSPDINEICGIISDICSTLYALQKIAHDKENTNITQDYKDFETIIGDDATGLIGYVADAYEVCVSIYNTIDEWERITQK